MAITLDGTTGITTPGLTNTGSLSIVNFTTSGNTILGDASTDTLNVGNGGLVKDASGNVGIGTASPAQKLDVNGTVRATNFQVNAGYAVFKGLAGTGVESAINNPITSGSTADLAFYTHTGSTQTERMRLDSSGNLGLGVTPSASTSNYRTFQIGSSGNSFSILGQRVAGASEGFLGWNVYGGSNTTTLGSGFYYRNTGDAATLYTQNAQHTWFTAPSGTAGNAITFTQAMTLDASGNLGIGTATPKTAATRLTTSIDSTRAYIAVESTTSTGTDAIAGYNTYTWNGSAQALGLQLYSNYSLSTSDGNAAFLFNVRNAALVFGTNNTERMRIDSAGNVGIGVTPSAWVSTAKAIQLPGGSMWSTSSVLQFNQNSFYNGTNYIYSTTAQASDYYQYQGAHGWRTAPSGTAGNAITFTQAMTLDASSNLTVNGYFLADGFSSPTTRYYSLRSGYVPNATGGVGMMAADLGTGNYDGLRLSGHQGIVFSTSSGTERVRIDVDGNMSLTVGSITSKWLSGMYAGGGVTPSTAVSAAQYYLWAAASARGSWVLAGGSPQYAAYYTGGNNDYLVWNLLCHQGSSLYVNIVYHNHADSASRTAAVDYSFNGGSTWINLNTITFTSSGGTNVNGTISLTGGLSLGRNVKIRTYFTSGAAASNLIGVGRCFFEMTGGSFQYINSLG